MPKLLFSRQLYLGWSLKVASIVGWPSLLAAVTGLVLWSIRVRSAVGIGLLAGYVAHCLFFQYAAMTHDYYHVTLHVAVALGLAALVDHVALHLIRPRWRRVTGGILAVIVLAFGFLAPLSVRGLLLDTSSLAEAHRLEALGGELGVATRVVSLGKGYGYPLMFHGWLLAVPWPYRVDLEYERLVTGAVMRRKYRLQRLFDDFDPRYFVVTDPEEWKGQPGLEGFLRERYQLIAERPLEGIWVFALK